MCIRDSDEASMVNVELFYDLIRAVKPGGRLIVCGDKMCIRDRINILTLRPLGISLM